MDNFTFKDKRGRDWESFCDVGYYHMTCVRVAGETDFNSPLSFHFDTGKLADEFIALLKQAS